MVEEESEKPVKDLEDVKLVEGDPLKSHQSRRGTWLTTKRRNSGVPEEESRYFLLDS